MPFSQKNVHIFLFVFPFFHLKKQKSIYTTLVFTLGIYTFLFFNGKKENKQKKYVHFFVKRHYNYSSFFSGTLFFFRDYNFFQGLYFFGAWICAFFSFLALNPLEPIIFEYTNFFRGTDFPT